MFDLLWILTRTIVWIVSAEINFTEKKNIFCPDYVVKLQIVKNSEALYNCNVSKNDVILEYSIDVIEDFSYKSF